MLLVPLLASLSGCFWLHAGRTALSILPVITHSPEATQPTPGVPAQAHSPVRLVRDDAKAWRRTVSFASGLPFDPARYRQGDRLRVQWFVPMQIGNGVEAIAGVGEGTCLTGQMLEPTTWFLQAANDAATASSAIAPAKTVTGEAWFVSRQSPTALDHKSGHLRLGFLYADALGARTGLPGRAGVSWLLIVPGPGQYVLHVTWEGTDPRQVLGAQPCLVGWATVPLPWAMAATMGRHGASSSTWDLTGGVDAGQAAAARTNTSDAGAWLSEGATQSPAASAMRVHDTGAVVGAPADTVHLVTATRRVVEDLGLKGVPEYDLVLLHQQAVILDVGVGHRPVDFQAGMRAIRAQRLASLAVSAAGKDKLCYLATDGALGTRKLAVWGGEPTIPERYTRTCAPLQP